MKPLPIRWRQGTDGREFHAINYFEPFLRKVRAALWSSDGDQHRQVILVGDQDNKLFRDLDMQTHLDILLCMHKTIACLMHDLLVALRHEGAVCIRKQRRLVSA
jgi:hypothetical protein